MQIVRVQIVRAQLSRPLLAAMPALHGLRPGRILAGSLLTGSSLAGPGLAGSRLSGGFDCRRSALRLGNEVLVRRLVAENVLLQLLGRFGLGGIAVRHTAGMHAARGKEPVEVLGGGLQAGLELLLPAVAAGLEDGVAQDGVDVVHAAVVLAPGNGVHFAHVAGASFAGRGSLFPGKAAFAVHPVEETGDVGRCPLEIALPALGAVGRYGLLAQLAEALA